MLEIHLFGPPEVTIDGTPIEVDTRKAIALLAYLVVEKNATRDALAGLLWADSSQERARSTLRRTLSALRSATGDSVDADRNQISLTDAAVSDVQTVARELEATYGHDHDPHDVCPRCIPHLRRATELYRGDFLQGFSAKASPEFDDWVRRVSESTRIRVGEAFHRLGTALAATGDYPAATTATRRWIELDPLHEPAYRFLMLLRAWAGDRAGAIEAYQSCVAVLDKELGVPPLEETTELYEAILDEDLPPAPGAPRRVKAMESPRTTPADLIDREQELDFLRRAWRDSRAGRGRRLVVVGGPWMGKTRLLEEIAAEASGQDGHVVIGRAFRMEQELPYGVATRVVRATMSRMESKAIELPEWVHDQIGRLLPDFGGAVVEDVPDQFGELRLFEAIYRSVAALAADGPLLLALDDVQWIDHPSAQLASYLARRISDLPVLMLISARPAEALSAQIADLTNAPDHTVTLGPLTIEHLLPLVGDKDKLARTLLDETGGVPLLVSEALTTARGETRSTPGMARYIESRLTEVGDLPRQILAAAAVLHGMCDPGLLRETSGRSEEEVVEAVEELLAADLLREVPDSQDLAFTLDAMESLTYDSTSVVRRRLLHRRAAHALAARPHARADVITAAAVAGHHEAAADPEAGEWYLLAGHLSRAVYANDSARQMYQSSLALGVDRGAEARLALGELEMAQGNYEEARRQLSLAASQATDDTLGAIRHRMGEVERLLGRFDLAEEHYRQAIASGAPAHEVLPDWALLAKRTGRAEEAIDLAEKARVAAEEKGGAAERSRVRNVLAVVSQDPDVALEHAEEALTLAGDDQLLTMAALNNMAFLLAAQGHPDRAIPLIEQAIEIADRAGHRHREAALWNHLADLQHRQGREERARESQLRAIALFADVDSGSFEPELWLLSRW